MTDAPTCEGRMMSHAHNDEDVAYYALINFEGDIDTKAWLCPHCVNFDRRLGFIWQRLPKSK
jgi:hypothetical protein